MLGRTGYRRSPKFGAPTVFEVGSAGSRVKRVRSLGGEGLAEPGERSILVLMTEQINHMGSARRVAPFDGTYREVLGLLEEARDLAASPLALNGGIVHANDHRAAPHYPVSVVRLEASCEALRVTSRLTHCLAWVMVHKAIQAGELSPDAAYDPENRLSGESVCLAKGGEENPRLPGRLRHLLGASRALYVRLARLDARMSSVPAGA